MYRCTKCGFEFGEEGIETIQYQEYSGATTQKEFVSACCHAVYDDIDDS